MLKSLEVPKGEYIIQSAAGSTLGKIVIYLAKHWGVKTINIVRRSSQKVELEALGADEVICSGEEDVVARVKGSQPAGTAPGAPFNAVCGDMTPMLTAGVRDDGKVLLYGLLGGYSTTLGAGDLFRGVVVTSFVSFKAINLPDEIPALAAEVASLVKSGIIPAAAVEKYDLKDFKKAFA